MEIVLMPDADGSGDVIEFCLQVGDQVSIGDSMIVIESDKASMEIPSSVEGTVVEWLIEMGDSIEKGRPLARVDTSVETQVELKTERSGNDVSDINVERPIITNLSIDNTAMISVQSVDAPAKKVVGSTLNTPLLIDVVGSIYAGPATRKFARELGVDLSRVTGSGTRSRILKDDVKQFVKHCLTQPLDNVASGALPGLAQRGIPTFPEVDFSRFGPVEERALSGIAKATSAHMTRCWLNIPHVTLSDEVDITDLEAFRATINPDVYGLEKKPTLLPFIIMIVAKALRKYPQFNTSLHVDGERIIYKDYVHIGVAVDTPAGLVVPVIRDADKKSISELAKALADLVVKANARKLKAEDMQGGCFTVSSLGVSGGTGFTPIINGPEVAILGVARSSIKPVWDGQVFIPRKQLPLCLSFDHRVVNGGDAGRFMVMLHQCLAQIGNTIL
ncbi:2-oxo acid dehydrogenase subunit E2 [Neptunomonas antarctica]|nr:2-oxo acid dehydrogenase subunit E2 [Neptunomonas antarctica]